MYDDFLKRVAHRFDTEFSMAAPAYNFDYGDELEVALRRVLRIALPGKYGVCRGQVVTQDGRKAGDDLIVYEQMLMPTLGLREESQLDRITTIPVEGAYAYIEAKHTLFLDGDDGQSLEKANGQVESVKKLCSSRTETPFNLPHLPSEVRPAAIMGGCPDRLDPPFGIVFARNVKIEKKDKSYADHAAIEAHLQALPPFNGRPFLPDILILGPHTVVIPTMQRADGTGGQVKEFVTPFRVAGKSDYTVVHAKDIAYAVGYCSLMYALEFIKLGPMPWRNVLQSGLFPPPKNQAEPVNHSTE